MSKRQDVSLRVSVGVSPSGSVSECERRAGRVSRRASGSVDPKGRGVCGGQRECERRSGRVGF